MLVQRQFLHQIVLFPPHSTYIASVSTGAKDTSGNPLAGNYAWVFTTARDYSGLDGYRHHLRRSFGDAYYHAYFTMLMVLELELLHITCGTAMTGLVYTYLVKSANGLQWGSPVKILGLGDDSDHTQVYTTLAVSEQFHVCWNTKI